MTPEQEIKVILVHFFREGTNGDYLEALNTAVRELKESKSLHYKKSGDRHSP